MQNDSADEGFGIESDRTHDIVLFTLHDVKKDGEGDIQYWEFRVYNPKRLANLAGLKAKIFND